MVFVLVLTCYFGWYYDTQSASQMASCCSWIRCSSTVEKVCGSASMSDMFLHPKSITRPSRDWPSWLLTTIYISCPPLLCFSMLVKWVDWHHHGTKKRPMASCWSCIRCK
ncbi:hypothetical protein BT63DRAFT_314555 [Microthyrium microscopicum]|uniref:Secreted protein n=1 Tax=Microthyrium microscopicum TaxID=703497 RepID=A0A6A6U307_9PEZI|nr:hypothetical protein BT63DRAFT_314555 [Microthyrium microscopicum]